ncbi:DUF1963 domain-containing protein [Flagellimonas sp.]|uniref:DUF1963 domain-containing protein n=1 Tax=Flagellimonas sp. TaxID=2058762 RepID=UPI003AB275D5
MYYKKATEIIDDFLKRNDLSKFGGEIRGSITPYLDFKQTRINPQDEASVPLGASKMYGLPHLPDSIKFPPGLYFIAQFNCSDLKPYDVYNVLPENGIFYFFVDESCEETSCHYYDGPLDQLKIQDYPEQKRKLSDQKLFRSQPRTISFEESEFLVLHSDYYCYEKLGKLSSALLDELQQALGDHLILDDEDQGGHIISGDYIFGDGCFYQGGYDDEYGDEDDDYADHIVLFCFGIGEGHVNFFIRNGELDLNKDINEQIVGVYSGT